MRGDETLAGDLSREKQTRVIAEAVMRDFSALSFGQFDLGLNES